MKKKLLFAFCAASIGLNSMAQCDPASIDWGTATYGVSPNPSLGENFDPAYLGQPFTDAVFVLCPTNAGDIDPSFGTAINIDSISLDSITIFNGLQDVQMSAVGLNVTCNNNGDSPNPCMFLPGNAYCGDISGTPTAAGTFDVKIWVTIFFQAFGPQNLPYSFDGYTLNIAESMNVEESSNMEFVLSNNSPNPASNFTNINFNMPVNSDVQLSIVNLVGETVFMKNIKARKGENSFRLETEQFETGIYLYSLETSSKKLTRKMIIQH